MVHSLLRFSTHALFESLDVALAMPNVSGVDSDWH
jgi:hypothetical protein